MPGDSDAASAAACAKRFDGPITKVSKVNFGFRCVGTASARESAATGERCPFFFFSWYEAGVGVGGTGAGAGGSSSSSSSFVSTSSRDGSTVMAMRTGRPRFTDRAVVSLFCALSSIHCFVKPLGTARRIVPSISPSGRAERSIDVATGPSSSVGTASRATAHARVRESGSTTISEHNIR